jgi:methylaspartate ammonia-lyase
MTTDLPEALVNYLVKRDTDRAAATAAVLDKLTPWERHLVHDAAVMGYVQGLMRDREDGVPKDSQVMALVVQECMAMPDLYPAIDAVAQRPSPAPA